MLPCYGTSPNGHRWIYVQPQHTGSQTVVKFLRETLNVTSCGHGHFPAALLPAEIQRENFTFAFSFVANPYRRVLSNAAFHRAFNTRGSAPLRPSAEQVELFNQRVVRSRPGSDGNNVSQGLFPVDDFQRACGDARQAKHCWDVVSQTAMLGGYRSLRFVGCSESLASDLSTVLRLLGYVVPGDGQLQLHRRCHSERCATDYREEDEGSAAKNGSSPTWCVPNVPNAYLPVSCTQPTAIPRPPPVRTPMCAPSRAEGTLSTPQPNARPALLASQVRTRGRGHRPHSVPRRLSGVQLLVASGRDVYHGTLSTSPWLRTA